MHYNEAKITASKLKFIDAIHVSKKRETKFVLYCVNKPK